VALNTINQPIIQEAYREVIVQLIDIGGFIDHQCLNFLYIINDKLTRMFSFFFFRSNYIPGSTWKMDDKISPSTLECIGLLSYFHLKPILFITFHLKQREVIHILQQVYTKNQNAYLLSLRR
jgi:hypothetical protein